MTTNGKLIIDRRTPYIRRFHRGAGLLALALVSGGCAAGRWATTGALERSPEISGSYEISYTSRDGSSYEGTLEISPLRSGLYWLEWRDSDQRYAGKGALYDKTLTAVWGSSPSRCIAVVLGEGADDGILEGSFFRAGERNEAASSITAVPRAGRGDDFSGVYSVTVDGPDSANLAGELQVAALGDGYLRFLWAGAEPLEGRGRLDEGEVKVVVGSGGECRISEMSLADDGSLSWTWMISYKASDS